MAARLSEQELVRLARLLGMCGSAHLGERAAAALAADRMVRDAGCTWTELLLPDPKAADLDPGADLDRNWRQTARNVAGNRAWLDRLNAWEISFICELPSFPELSERQVSALRRILAKLHAGAQA